MDFKKLMWNPCCVGDCRNKARVPHGNYCELHIRNPKIRRSKNGSPMLLYTTGKQKVKVIEKPKVV